MRRALIVAFAAALVIVPTAGAWTWPVKGPVLQKFVLGDDPYAAGQHRGIDIGAGAGEPVLAPASGLVSFAGTVPVSGKVVTIQTADGYSVTLTHLGSTSVRRGETVGEDAVVGTIGPDRRGRARRPIRPPWRQALRGSERLRRSAVVPPCADCSAGGSDARSSRRTRTVGGSAPRSGRTAGGRSGGDPVPAGAKPASLRAAHCGHASTPLRWLGCVTARPPQ